MKGYVRRETHEALKRELKAARTACRMADSELARERKKVGYQCELLASLATQLQQQEEEAARLHEEVLEPLKEAQRVIAAWEPIVTAAARKGAGI